MSETSRAVIGLLLDKIGGIQKVSVEKATAYWGFLKKASLLFLALTVFLLLSFFISVILYQDRFIIPILLLISLTTTVFLLLTAPLDVLIISLGTNINSVKIFLRFVGGFLLWSFILALYFSKVPVSNNPNGAFLILLIVAIIALFWAVYGIGPNPRRVYGSVVSMFVLVTLSFFFPKTTTMLATKIPEVILLLDNVLVENELGMLDRRLTGAPVPSTPEEAETIRVLEQRLALQKEPGLKRIRELREQQLSLPGKPKGQPLTKAQLDEIQKLTEEIQTLEKVGG